MKKIFLFFFLLVPPLHATHYAPWFSPPWEFQGQMAFFYDHAKTVQSPKGDFNAPRDTHSLRSSLSITPWPYWNAEIEMYLTRTSDIPFSYEAAISTIRYQWLDDIQGDPCALVTGLTLSFPGDRYLHNVRFTYHGNLNSELHISIGKEWSCDREWWMRMWALGGWGIANRGQGWLHGLAVVEFQPTCLEWGLFTEAVIGLGSHDILPNEPFGGYASIAHRTLDIGGFTSYPLSNFGTISVMGWYTAYAHNCMKNGWGIGALLLIPFSL